MDSIASTITYQKHNYSDTDSGDEFTMLGCRPVTIPHSLTTLESQVTLRLNSKPEYYKGSRWTQYADRRLDANPGENSNAHAS